MIYYLKEEEVGYKSSSIRKHLISLVGEPATEKLYSAWSTGNAILRASRRDYIKAGLTEIQVERLIAAKEIGVEPESQIRCSQDMFDHMRFLMHEHVEHFYVICLSRANKVLSKVKISEGGTSGTVVDVKVLYSRVLKVALLNSIILVHNHPSGNLNPSQPDLDVTKKIIDAGKVLDIKVLDHLIIGNNDGKKYLSFADEGYL